MKTIDHAANMTALDQLGEGIDRVIAERDELRRAFRNITQDNMVLESAVEVLRAQVERMRPVYEAAKEARAVEFTDESMLDSVKRVARLHDAVDAAIAAEQNERAGG